MQPPQRQAYFCRFTCRITYSTSLTSTSSDSSNWPDISNISPPHASHTSSSGGNVHGVLTLRSFVWSVGPVLSRRFLSPSFEERSSEDGAGFLLGSASDALCCLVSVSISARVCWSSSRLPLKTSSSLHLRA